MIIKAAPIPTPVAVPARVPATTASQCIYVNEPDRKGCVHGCLATRLQRRSFVRRECFTWLQVQFIVNG